VFASGPAFFGWRGLPLSAWRARWLDLYVLSGLGALAVCHRLDGRARTLHESDAWHVRSIEPQHGRDLGRHRYLVGHESVVTEPGEADDEQCSQSEDAYRRVPLSAAIRDWWSLDRWSAS
jgi:hypothetical protein